MQSPLLHSNSVSEQLVLCLPHRVGSDLKAVLPGKHSHDTCYQFKTNSSAILSIQTHQKRIKLYLCIFVQSTEILAASVEGSARIGSAIVRCVVNGDDSHRSWNFLAKPNDILTSELAGSQNSVEDPVSPEDEIAVDGDVERMLGRDFGQHDSMFTIKIGSLDLVQSSIRPV